MSKKKLKTLPQFKDESEEQEFWATHEIVDFIDTSKPTEFELSQIKPSIQNFKHEHSKVKNGYAAFKNIKGIGGKDHKDASTTIDELLYSENGAWRGSGE